MKKCPYCGEQIQDDAVKCRFCGEWLSDKPSEVTDVVKTDSKLPSKKTNVTKLKTGIVSLVKKCIPRTKKQKIVGIIVCVLILGCMAWGGYNIYVHCRIKHAVTEFFDAVHRDSSFKMSEIYTKVGELYSYRKSDNIEVNDISSIGDGNYEVQLTNHYTNGFGRISDTDMSVFVRSADNDYGYEIYDSKDFMMLDDDDAFYRYAQKKFTKTADTDLKKAKIVKETMETLALKVVLLRSELEEKVKISSWSWDTGYYSDYASGKAIVKNNSKYNIKKLKYKVKYYRSSSSSTPITEDEGRVSYDAIPAYGSCSFSFYTSYVGDAHSANLKLEFDDEELIKLAIGEDD